jgi:hypothetical protein
VPLLKRGSMAKVIGHLNVELVDTMVVDENEVELYDSEVETSEARKRFKQVRLAVAEKNFGVLSAPVHDAICALIDAISAVEEGNLIAVEGYSVAFEKPRRFEA